jgi:hypothetical protein
MTDLADPKILAAIAKADAAVTDRDCVDILAQYLSTSLDALEEL